MTQRAFTLIELLMATVLSSVLMIGVLSVITSLGSPGSPGSPGSLGAAGYGGGSPAGSGGVPVESLVELLRADLRHAESIETDENSITLVGPAGLDPKSFQVTHRPVRIQYLIREIDERAWLVRKQSALDALTNRNTQTHLVCRGIERFELTTVDPQTLETPETTETPENSETQTTESSPVGAPIVSTHGGDPWRLNLWFDLQREEPALSRLITIR